MSRPTKSRRSPSCCTYDERLGQLSVHRLRGGGEKPIGDFEVKNGGFQITVAGKRYGKGSSREAEPAGRTVGGHAAGRRARASSASISRTATTSAFFTTTDFCVLDRIARARRSPIDEFLAGRDALTQQIIRSGGLLAYSKRADWRAPRAREAGAERPVGRRRWSRRSSSAICIRAPRRAERRRRRVRRRRLAFHPRLFHRHVRAPDARAFGKPLRAARAGSHHRVPGSPDPTRRRAVPHVQRRPAAGRREPDARAHATFARGYPVRAHGALPGRAVRHGSDGICTR